MKRISVAIACDSAPGNFQQATAIRGVLEAFSLQVHLYQFIQKQNVLDFLAGSYPECDYVIFCCYGKDAIDGEKQLIFHVVHQIDNDYDNKNGWDRIDFILTPSNLSQYVKNPKGTLICGGAASGEVWAKAFLSVGYKVYIAPAQEDLACNSKLLFIIGFFYHLLMHRLDYTDKIFTPQESVAEAAAMDKHYEFGTQLFRYYSEHC
jgi:hypothetical protein